jgi:hypothetical protein
VCHSGTLCSIVCLVPANGTGAIESSRLGNVVTTVKPAGIATARFCPALCTCVAAMSLVMRSSALSVGATNKVRLTVKNGWLGFSCHCAGAASGHWANYHAHTKVFGTMTPPLIVTLRYMSCHVTFVTRLVCCNLGRVLHSCTACGHKKSTAADAAAWLHRNIAIGSAAMD